MVSSAKSLILLSFRVRAIKSFVCYVVTIFSDSNMIETPKQQMELSAPGKPETTQKAFWTSWAEFYVGRVGFGPTFPLKTRFKASTLK